MTRFIVTVVLFCLCLSVAAHRTITIADNTIEDGVKNTIPVRNVEKHGNGVTVSYFFEKAILDDDPLFQGCKFLYIDGFGENHTAGEYSFLQRLDDLSIPAGCKAKVELIDYQYVDIPFKLAPSRPMLFEKESAPRSQNDIPAPKPYQGFYPAETVSVMYSGDGIARILVRPIQYNAEAGILRIPKKLVYSVIFVEYDTDSQNTSLSPSRLKAISNIALNKHKIPETESQGIMDGYIIISTSKYAKAVKRLSEWKRMLGFEVNYSFKDSWNNATIKSEIKRMYSLQQSPKYLLIVGDNDDVPGIRKYCSYGPYITDYYYGFITPDTLGLPALHRGRIPVNTAEEANRVIDKIINYEMNPIIDSAFYKMASHGSYFQDTPAYPNEPGDGYEDRMFSLTSEYIRSYLMQQGKEIQRIYYTPDYVTPTHWNNTWYSYGEEIPIELQKPNFAWGGNTEDVVNAINDGRFYVFHRGHGDINKWAEPKFQISDLVNIRNSRKTPVFFNINCLSGRFEDDCLAENLLKMAGGCSGIVAASKESFSGPNDAFAFGLFDAIWPTPGLRPIFRGSSEPSTYVSEPIYGLGDILDQGLIRMEESYPSSYSLHQREIFHCLGDPGMMITTETPTNFECININRTDNSITVKTNGEKAFMSFYDSSSNVQSVAFSNEATFICGNPDDVSVVVSGHNKIPYIDYSNTKGIIYLQNQSIESNRNYRADTIYIGSHVTSEIPFGETVFSSGNINLVANRIIFESGTKIKNGVKLKTEQLK